MYECGKKEKERNCPSVTPKIVEGNATELFIHSYSLLLLSILCYRHCDGHVKYRNEREGVVLAIREAPLE